MIPQPREISFRVRQRHSDFYTIGFGFDPTNFLPLYFLQSDAAYLTCLLEVRRKSWLAFLPKKGRYPNGRRAFRTSMGVHNFPSSYKLIFFFCITCSRLTCLCRSPYFFLFYILLWPQSLLLLPIYNRSTCTTTGFNLEKSLVPSSSSLFFLPC